MSDSDSLSVRISDNFDSFFKSLAGTVTTWKGNFVRNSTGSFSGMTVKNWLRLTVIVCAYLLIRPHLLRLAAKVQEGKMAEEARKSEAELNTKMNANDLRSGKIEDIPNVDEDNDSDADAGEWGRRARVRQRKIIKMATDRHEKDLIVRSMDSDEDIADLLQ